MTKDLSHYDIVFDLQLFADGAGDGAAAQVGATSPVAAALAQRAEQAAKKNPLAAVQYGKQEATGDTDVPADDAKPAENEGKDEGGEKQAETAAERSARFESLIKGEFKDLYAKKVQSTVQDRLKGVSSKAEKFDQLEQALSLLAGKYNIDPTDAKALAAAISGDDDLYEKEALESGRDVESVKAQKIAEAENRRLNAYIDEQKRNEAARQLYERWMSEGEATKALYPSFDLDAEILNEKFVSLIRNNVDVTSAYEIVHKDEIIPAVIRKAEQAEGERIASKYAQTARRPAPNGSSSQSAAVVKNDVTKLTKADREEIDRRVARGEKIVF